MATQYDLTHQGKPGVVLTLGTGLAHKIVIEEDWDFDLEVVPTPAHPPVEDEAEEDDDDGDWELEDLSCENGQGS